MHGYYDYIVVGSGSAGAIVAHRLAEDRRTRVLLLEAGGPTSLMNDIPAPATVSQQFWSNYDWNYTYVPQFVGRAYQYGRIHEPRGLAIGGSSTINTMVFEFTKYLVLILLFQSLTRDHSAHFVFCVDSVILRTELTLEKYTTDLIVFVEVLMKQFICKLDLESGKNIE